MALALTEKEITGDDLELLKATDLLAMFDLADRHRILSILYHGLEKTGEQLPALVQHRMEDCAEYAVKQSYRLLFLTREIVELAKGAGIPVIVLKGAGAASWYPVPEYRKSGDVDLLMKSQEDLEKLGKLMQEKGFFLKEEQHATHHSVYSGKEGIDVELHLLLAEPFEDGKLNKIMAQLQENCFSEGIQRDCMGVLLPVAEDSMQALALLLHMLQHFLRAGFGLKLLADWVVFWNGEHVPETAERYRKLAEKCGLDGFSKAVTLICEFWLGLEKNRIYEQSLKDDFSEGYEEVFLKEIIEAEEFGKSASDRMVALHHPGLGGYLSEFHHQMKLNHPVESRKKWKWPWLWVKTLVVFLNNNRKLHRGSASEILKKAGERAKIVKEMRLYE